VGYSVFRCVNPRASKSDLSTEYASDPVNKGCHPEYRSWRKPGSVTSAVRMFPPIQEFRSRTQTFHPAFARITAPTKALIPLPTNIASQESIATFKPTTSSNLSCLRITQVGIRHRPPV